MTHDPHTMDLAACRDWVARDEGWWRGTMPVPPAHGSEPQECWWKGEKPTDWRASSDSFSWIHPIGSNLDAAAGALPEGWGWRKMGMAPVWEATQWRWSDGVSVPETDDEILDRFRLAVAARIASKKNL